EADHQIKCTRSLSREFDGELMLSSMIGIFGIWEKNDREVGVEREASQASCIDDNAMTGVSHHSGDFYAIPLKPSARKQRPYAKGNTHLITKLSIRGSQACQIEP